jgi:hypothetical protein
VALNILVLAVHLRYSYFPKVGFFSVSLRRPYLYYATGKDRPFSVGALTEQSSGPPSPLSQKVTEYCQSQSYVTTGGQATSLSWCQAPI